MRRNVSKKILGTLNKFSGHVIHLTHTDLDAVCCDAIFRRKFDNVMTIFSSVQDYTAYLDLFARIERSKNLTICLSDLGGRESAIGPIKSLKQKGWRIEWRDHHIWQKTVLENVRRVIDYLRVDRDFCACEIVYQDLLQGDTISQEIAAIGRDRDFWINRDHRSEVLSTAVNEHASRGMIASKLSAGIFADPEIEHLYALQTARKNKSISNALRSAALFDHTAVTISDGYTSDVAAAVREKYKSRTELVLRANGIFSVRTIAPVSNQIAMMFGGGGHPHAAGGNLNFTIAERIGFRFFTYRVKKVRALIDTASQFD